MAVREIRIGIPEREFPVAGDDLAALVTELRAIADGAPRLCAAQLLAEEIDGAAEGAAIEPDDRQKYALLRALSHLTRPGGHNALIDLRETVSNNGGVKWRAYRLNFVDEARPDEDFTSYTLNYEPGDRLVTSASKYRVVAITTAEPTILHVEEWAPIRPRQVPTFVFDRKPPAELVSITREDGVAIADVLASYDDEQAHAAAQKILAAMNLPTRSTDIRLNVLELEPVLTAAEALQHPCGKRDIDRLMRTLREMMPA